MTTLIDDDIAGYIHNAENKCPECIRLVAKLALLDEGYWKHGDATTEQLLNVLALLWDVDRDCVDSNDFPVPFSKQQADTERAWAAFEGANDPVCACGNDFCGEF